jgi:hypothetical protein
MIDQCGKPPAGGIKDSGCREANQEMESEAERGCGPARAEKRRFRADRWRCLAAGVLEDSAPETRPTEKRR